jgi:genome maintenance exonuclease 1
MTTNQRIMYNNNRFYNINNFWFPSVTSILKQLSEDGISRWKQRIGKEQADKIIQYSTERGTRVHLYCELYLKNNYNMSFEVDLMENFNDVDINYFKNTFTSYLNNISNIKLLEGSLYSNKYKYAGTVDCIGEYDKQLSIIDFKTSEKPKLISYITSYFLQTAAYSIAYEEITGIKIDNLVIIIGVNSTMETQIFTENINNICHLYNLSWKDTFLKLLEKFNKLNSYPIHQ